MDKLDPERKTAAIFSHILYDATFFYGESLFADYEEWLVEAVRAAGGMVGGEALFDPRYEPEMRRFLIRALEMEGIPVPRGGDRP